MNPEERRSLAERWERKRERRKLHKAECYERDRKRLHDYWVKKRGWAILGPRGTLKPWPEQGQGPKP